MHDTSTLDPRLALLKNTANAMTAAAQRDLVEYWGRRRLEARPYDLT